MQVIVLTGGLGAGKSTAAEFFRSRGAVAIDLDVIAAHLMAPGSSLLASVADAFGGDDVLLADGRLDRSALARLAFCTPEATARLNALVHPAVVREIGPSIADMRLLQDPPPVVVLEVPLLAEAPVFAELADIVVAIVGPESVRSARAVERGMSPDDAARRLRAQATDAERAELADVLIVNDGPLDRFTSALERFWEEYVVDGGSR
jgi:dephospho-CoA kinase